MPAGRGGAVGPLPHRHATKAVAGHAVHVLVRSNGVEAAPLVDVRRHRVLEQDAVDVRRGVQAGNCVKEFLGAGFLRQLDAPRLHANAPAGVALHAHVHGRSGVVTHEDGGQRGYFTAGLREQTSNPLGQSRFHLLRKPFAVKNDTGHPVSFQGGLGWPALRSIAGATTQGRGGHRNFPTDTTWRWCDRAPTCGRAGAW